MNGLLLHDATSEQYESVPTSEHQDGPTRWKWYTLGSLTITVFAPRTHASDVAIAKELAAHMDHSV